MRIASTISLALALCFAASLRAQQPEPSLVYEWHQNSQMQHDSVRFKSFEIVPGPYMVFAFESNNVGEPGNHSEAPSGLYFQVPMGADEFHLENLEIRKHGGLYLQPCRCADRGFQYVDNGVIAGERKNETTWLLKVDVTCYGATTGKRYEFHFEAEFQLSNP